MNKLLLVTGMAGVIALSGCNLKGEDTKPAGDLESLHPMACVDYTEIESSDTPADIAQGASKCMADKDYDRAAHMIMVGTAFASYDAQRVADETAHSATKAVFKDTFNPENRAEMGALIGALMKLDHNEEEKGKVCSFLAEVEKPSYRPDYMISHGSNPQDPALVTNFDADAAWQNAMHTIECTQ